MRTGKHLIATLTDVATAYNIGIMAAYHRENDVTIAKAKKGSHMGVRVGKAFWLMDADAYSAFCDGYNS